MTGWRVILFIDHDVVRIDAGADTGVMLETEHNDYPWLEKMLRIIRNAAGSYSCWPYLHGWLEASCEHYYGDEVIW